MMYGKPSLFSLAAVIWVVMAAKQKAKDNITAKDYYFSQNITRLG